MAEGLPITTEGLTMSGDNYLGRNSNGTCFGYSVPSSKRKRTAIKPRSNAYNGSCYRAVQPRARAVRQVTQNNAGKKTPGVDGKTALSTKERLQLCRKLNKHWYT